MADTAPTTATPAEATPAAPEAASSLFQAAAARTHAAVQQVVSVVAEYDAALGASQQAKVFLVGALDVVTAAATSLKEQAAALSTVPAKQLAVRQLQVQETVGQVKAGLVYVSEMARSYDEKYQMSSTLVAAIAGAKDMAHKALAEVTAQVQQIAAKAKAADADADADADATAEKPEDTDAAAAAAPTTTGAGAGAGVTAADAADGEAAPADTVAALRARVTEAYQSVNALVTQVVSNKAAQVAEAKEALAGALHRATAAAEDLRQTAALISSVPLRELPRQAAVASLNRAKAAVQGLTEAAEAFDKRHGMTETVTTTVSAATESVTNTVAAAKEKASAAVPQGRELLRTTLDKAITTADHGVDSALAVARRVDARFNVTGKAKDLDTRLKIVETATQLGKMGLDTAKAVDERYSVTERATKLDQRLTGGAGAAAVATGMQLAGAGLQYLAGKLAGEPEAEAEAKADEAEDKAAPAAGDAAEADADAVDADAPATAAVAADAADADADAN